jgi:hypothetical protein
LGSEHRQKFLEAIHVRGEQIIETESHNSPDANAEAKQRASRVAAEIIVEGFKCLPEVDRREWMA